MYNTFEFATRNKLRFPFKGSISVEDLWDLNVRDLDTVFKTLNARVKNTQEESLLAVRNEEDETLFIMIDIVRYIVDVKLAEAEAILHEKERSERKQKLMALIADKQDEDLRNKSVDELKEMLNELN